MTAPTRVASLGLALLWAALPAGALADASAATLFDRLTHTVYPQRAVPAGYDIPISSEPAGTNPRQVLYTFTRTADRVVTQLRYDLFEDDASLKKAFPSAWSRPGFDVQANEVIYRVGSYHATCTAHYAKAKAQVADVCGMALGATVMNVETVFPVPPGTAIDPNTPGNAFLDSIRKTSTAFVTNGASYYLAVSGLGP